jgi:phosphoribosylanthranilate isomerase
MSVLVKICGLSDSHTVTSAIDAGADAVGFVFAKSVRRVSVDLAVEISRHVSSDVLRVAVMQHPTQEEWQLVADGFAPDVLQTDAADFDYLEVAESFVRWPVIREGQASADGSMPDVFVYEGKKSGQGETVDWQAAGNIARRGKMILAGGLGAHNVAQAISLVRPYGVDVSSAVEASPGKKDVRKIAAFVAAAKNTDTV